MYECSWRKLTLGVLFENLAPILQCPNQNIRSCGGHILHLVAMLVVPGWLAVLDPLESQLRTRNHHAPGPRILLRTISKWVPSESVFYNRRSCKIYSRSLDTCRKYFAQGTFNEIQLIRLPKIVNIGPRGALWAAELTWIPSLTKCLRLASYSGSVLAKTYMTKVFPGAWATGSASSTSGSVPATNSLLSVFKPCKV